MTRGPLSPSAPPLSEGGRTATLVSVNVGLPQDVAWQGKSVHTGVWKHPVTGPRRVRRLNVDGDGQGDTAGHGGEQRAVLVYQLDSYRHWQEHLGRDDFVRGQFGENFTVDGLPDDQVCIGDRYRIGDATFEVTQPRVTCYRVGIRLQEPRMASLLVSHGRPGFYLRVLTEGTVQAGDEIIKLDTGPGALSVAEINALLYLPGHPEEQLERALRIEALSPGWKASLEALLDGAGGSGNVGLTAAAASAPPAWPGFRRLRVSHVRAESDTVCSYTLATADGHALPAASAGQFITVRLPRPEANAPLIRTYSLSGAPGSAEYRISVKLEPRGVASGWLHDHAAPGLEVEVAAPRGVFTLAEGSGPVVLVSAGVGITPMLAMLHQLAAVRTRRHLWWLHGARNSADALFTEEVRELLAQLPHARARVCFSRPLPTDSAGVDYTDAGRLSADLVSALGLPHDATAYVCGPEVFMADMVRALTDAGLDTAHVRTEAFGAQVGMTPGIQANAASRTPHPPERQGDGPVRATVSFSRSGLTVEWREDGPTLLELAEACDVPVRWSCRTGVCHSCETAALSGTVAYDPEPLDEPAPGNVLLCCSRPRTDTVLDL